MSEKPLPTKLDRSPSKNGVITAEKESPDDDRDPGVATLHRASKDQRGRFKYNIFWRACFIWLDGLFWLGCKRSLRQEDLYAHPSEADSKYLLCKFNRHWAYEMQRKKEGRSARLWVVIIKCLWWRFFVHGALNVLQICLFIGQGLLTGQLSGYFSITNPTETDTRNAYLYAMGMTLLAIAGIFILGLGVFTGFKMGMLARVLVTSSIYQKVLTLSQTTVGQLTIGHVVNLASNDVHRFDMGFLFYHFVWVFPVHVILTGYFLYQEVQYAAIVGVGIVLLQSPLLIVFSKLFSSVRLKAARETDKRIKVMNEVIGGIRVIKMYAWETAFKRMVDRIRKTEMWIVTMGIIVRGINQSYFLLSVPSVMFSIFVVYTFIGDTPLNTKIVFTSLALVQYMRVSLHFFVLSTLQLTESHVAVKRITKFLVLEELPEILAMLRAAAEKKEPGVGKEVVSFKPATDALQMTENHNTIDAKLNGCKKDPCIIVKDMSASWIMSAEKITLSNISFSVTKDAPLLAVVGAVGAGKSTLLQCILSELPVLSGTVTLNGSLAYACQEPWIFSSSVRENILFGLHYDQAWYSTVIEACALEKDIDMLPDGDLTLVGERGVTLSGGQKARINLARAVYRRADLYLLDDPLSAVDAAVSRHIFDKCIRGLLSDSCVILVTHQLQYVQQCDSVLALKEGCVKLYGDPSDVLAEGFDVMDLLGTNVDLAEDEEKDPRKLYAVRKHSVVSLPEQDGKQVPGLQFERLLSNINEDNEDVDDEEEQEHNTLLMVPTLLDATSIYSQQSAISSPKVQTPQDKEKKKGPHLAVPAEERAHGRISVRTYYQYFKAGGGILFNVIVLGIFVIGESLRVVDDWWLADWAGCTNASNISRCDLSTEQRVGIYTGITGSLLLLAIGRIVLFYIVLMKAARILHNRMFQAVLRSPVLFFDTNPVGRVLNRFSKDTGFLDDLLPFSFCEFMQLVLRFFAILVAAIIANPYSLIIILGVLTAFMLLRSYYLRAARDVKRLEALARSPLYSHLSTMLQGLPTIRSYKMQSVSMEQFHEFHNQHTQSWYIYICASRWFGMRVDTISTTFVSTLAFSSILLSQYSNVNASLIGLALTYSINLSGMFQYCLRQSVEVESLMVSVERILAYSRLEAEASLDTDPPSSAPPPDWPGKGQIELSDLCYRHSPDGPLVLKGVSCVVKPREKVGIVGRTGAGKSSLIAALFRLAEPEGSIKIDGVNCLSLGLHDLRSKISIIPQDPVLFSGTIRYNLDPFSAYDDEKVWSALEQVQLKYVVENLKGLLQAPVSEAGTNFSVGQRQLFCLARALLRQNQILIMDEATANVDLETDAIIQQVIREQFSHCTVLTIAHRLDTVMDSDKIMVLRAGVLCEYGQPYELLSDPNSRLLHLVEHTGPVAAQRLKNMAYTAYQSRSGMEKIGVWV